MSQVENGPPNNERRTDSERIKISRGTVAYSKHSALSLGLAMENEGPAIRWGRNMPPGQFFYIDDTNVGGVGKASLQAKRGKQIGVVIEIDITPGNFPIFKGNIHKVKKHEDMSYSYRCLRSFRKLKKELEKDEGKGGGNEVTVNLEGLSQEDLAGAGVKVGFRESTGEFVFKSYKEWTDEMGIARTKSRGREQRKRFITVFRR